MSVTPTRPSKTRGSRTKSVPSSPTTSPARSSLAVMTSVARRRRQRPSRFMKSRVRAAAARVRTRSVGVASAGTRGFGAVRRGARSRTSALPLTIWSEASEQAATRACVTLSGMEPIDTQTVPFRDGTLAVRDYGGAGRALLCVPTLGICAPCWDDLAEHLVDRYRVLALDLPGHGQSTADLERFDDVWESIAAASSALGLDRPLLVGHDHSSSFVAQAAITDPQLASGVVAVGGSLVRRTEEVHEILELLRIPEVVEGLRTRFFFGARATDDELEEFLQQSSRQIAADDLAREHGGILREMRHQMLRRDGVWIRRPEIDAFVTAADFPADHALFPDERLIRDVPVPTWIVQLTEGDDSRYAARELDLAAELDHVQVRTIETGQWPQYTAVEELARIIALAADEVA